MRAPRLDTGAARLVDSNKRWVTLASGCLLILVPWMQISRAAASNISVTASSIAWVRNSTQQWLPLRLMTSACAVFCGCAVSSLVL